MLKRISVLLVTVVMVIGLKVSAHATTIGTNVTASSCCFGEFGVDYQPSTFGQTFRLHAGDDSNLESVAFYINDYPDPLDYVEFAFYVYQWDGNKISSSALFESSPLTTTQQPYYETFTVHTGGVALQVDTDYVFFMSAINFFDGQVGKGVVYSDTSNTYTDGSFVSMSNQQDFSVLSSTNWIVDNDVDLAFTMQLSPTSVPEPSTLLLLGSGLVGLGFVRKKFKN